MIIAYHSDPEVRLSATRTMLAKVESGALTGGSMYWDGSKGTPSAVLVESSDINHWVATLGLAPWIAYALDISVAGLKPTLAVDATCRVLYAIPLGANTTYAGGRVAISVLEDLQKTAKDVFDDPTEVEQCCAELIAIHLAASLGETVPAGRLREARRRANKLGGEGVGAARGGALMLCIESAAWDTVSSATTVGDILRCWRAFKLSNVADEFGWRESEDITVRALLEEMFTRYIKDNPNESRDVFTLLREYYPTVEARVLEYTQFQRRKNICYSLECARRVMIAVAELDGSEYIDIA